MDISKEEKTTKTGHPFYKKWWFWLVAIVVAVGGVMLSLKEVKDPSTIISTVSAESQPSFTQLYHAGETVDLNGVKLTINPPTNPETLDVDSLFSAHKEGNTYEVIEVTIENTTDKDVAFGSLKTFTLKDEDGRECSYLISGRDNGQFETTISPKEKKSGRLLVEKRYIQY